MEKQHKRFPAQDTQGERLIENTLIAKGGVYVDEQGKSSEMENAKFLYSKQWPLHTNANAKEKLTCDFVLFLDSMVFIEYDGEFHFKILSPGDKGFLTLFEQHSRDLLKDSHCEDEKIPLLRIRYDQQDLIDELLDDLLLNPPKYVLQHNPQWETYYAESEYEIKKHRR